MLIIIRLVNPYVQPVLYIRKPGDDHEQMISFPDDDPFFSEISNLIDIIEDIEEDPDAAKILSSYEGMPFSQCLSGLCQIATQMLSDHMSLPGPFGRPVNVLEPRSKKLELLQANKKLNA